MYWIDPRILKETFEFSESTQIFLKKQNVSVWLSLIDLQVQIDNFKSFHFLLFSFCYFFSRNLLVLKRLNSNTNTCTYVVRLKITLIVMLNNCFTLTAEYSFIIEMLRQTCLSCYFQRQTPSNMKYLNMPFWYF
jgi:hypothetical protein